MVQVKKIINKSIHGKIRHDVVTSTIFSRFRKMIEWRLCEHETSQKTSLASNCGRSCWSAITSTRKNKEVN